MWFKSKSISIPLLSTILISGILLTPVAAKATSPIQLGDAAHFQILSGTALTIGGGVIGADPLVDGVSAPAVTDLNIAIASVSGLSATSIPADLGGSTITPGIYKAAGGAAFAVTGNVVLNGLGGVNPTFIFYTPAAMNTTAGIVITLINGAQPQNVYWVIGGAITTGASGSLSGTFMSSAAITTGASNTLAGCLLGAAAVTIGASNVLGDCTQTAVVTPTGTLSISAPSAYQIPESVDGITTIGNIGPITVVDSRSGGAATTWTTSVETSSLTDPAGDSISPSAMLYSVSGLQSMGGITEVSARQASLAGFVAALTASGAGQPNSATWSALLTITIPDGQASGAYVGTITHSVY